MTYPTYDQLKTSRFIPITDIDVNQAPFGRFTVNTAFGNHVPGTFEIQHILTAAERASLLSDFTTNIATSFGFTWQMDNTSHTVFYGSVPVSTPHPQKPTEYIVTVRLVRDITFGSILLESGDKLLLENGDEILLEGA